MAPGNSNSQLNIRHNKYIYILIRKLLQTNIPGTIIKFIANTDPDNVNFKLAFHKVASFYPHDLTFTPQTYHHPVHRFRSWPMQMTSPSHPQARVQPRNIYNHTYRKCLPGQNNLILNPDKTTCTLFTPDPAEYMSNLDQKYTTMHNPWQHTQSFWVLL